MTTVSRGGLVAFGFSGLAQNIVGTLLGVHLFMYYTDVLGLAPLWVSAGLFVATLWNAVSDLLMGRLSDATRLKSGRRRPYMLLGAAPIGIAFVLLLAPPSGLSGNALGFYFVGVMIALFTATSVVQVPALSLLPEMAKSYHDRTRLAAARELLGNVGDLLGLLLPLAMMLAVGLDDADEAHQGALAREAFRYAAFIVAAIAFVAVLISYRGTYEDRRAAPQSTDLRAALRTLSKNRAFRLLIAASSLGALGLAFVQTLILYVLEHVMGEHDPLVHMSAFVVNAVAAIASYPVWTWAAGRWGKITCFRAGLALSSIAFSSVFFVGPGQMAALYAVMVFAGAANVGFWMLTYSLGADVADLDELENGERREGLLAGFSALIRKCAFAAAAAGVGLGLTAIGYQENAAQSASTILGLKFLFAIPPTILVWAALFVFRDYPLTRARHREVLAELRDPLYQSLRT